MCPAPTVPWTRDSSVPSRISSSAVRKCGGGVVFFISYLYPRALAVFLFLCGCNLSCPIGSCVAYASMAAIETCFKKKTGVFGDYSEQQMVDCGYAGKYGAGCGGAPVEAYGKIVQGRPHL